MLNKLRAPVGNMRIFIRNRIRILPVVQSADTQSADPHFTRSPPADVITDYYGGWPVITVTTGMLPSAGVSFAVAGAKEMPAHRSSHRLRCGQTGSTCARHISLYWIDWRKQPERQKH